LQKKERKKDWKSRLESYDCIYLEYEEKEEEAHKNDEAAAQHETGDWAYGKQKIHELFMQAVAS
jgi:hypothetical protein